MKEPLVIEGEYDLVTVSDEYHDEHVLINHRNVADLIAARLDMLGVDPLKRVRITVEIEVLEE